MLKTLQELFKKTEGQNPNDKLDVKLAAATLMFELIRSDGRVDELELSRMTELLKNQFKLDDDECTSLFALAKQNAKQAISLHAFTREICEQWDNEKRLELLENLWLLALSDEVIDPHERHLVRKVAGLLYINEAQIIQSREKAKQRLGIETNL